MGLERAKVHYIGGAATMSFSPINNTFAPSTYTRAHIVTRQDHTRHVEAHHFCARLSEDFHQCVIYDSNASDARLIGIEYIVSEKIFKSLPEEEKKFWHSHQYEVESGLLCIETRNAIPTGMNDTTERPIMLHLHQTYGKTIHTWAYDQSPELPLGPPQLVMSYTRDDQISDEAIRSRDERSRISTSAKKKLREGYLLPYQKDDKADQWEKSGTGILFKPEEVQIQK